MDEHFYEYRTGRTQPRKNRNGPVAFLLICVIFLCGIVSVLGMLNIHLFRHLQQKDANSSAAFSQGEDLPAATDGLSLSLEGMTLQELPSLYQKLYSLPQGLYITQVDPGSSAHKMGIAPGDVLTAVNGAAVTRLDALQALLQQMDGYTLELTIFQNGKQSHIPFPLND